IDRPPGAKFSYSGGDVALVAAIISRATHTPIEEYLRRKLFAPLGITQFEWVKDHNGLPIAAFRMRVRPRGMLKIGLLMRRHGDNHGRQIVPRDWADAATTLHIAVDDNPDCGVQYGYFWWLGPGCSTERLQPWFGGIGNGGQRIWVIPSRDLVIVTTAGLYD